MELDFNHIKYEFSPDLERMISPHFSDKEARQRLEKSFFSTKKIELSDKFILKDELILFANEAFPESAVNDPLGDLKMWNLWQTGIRSFPYPGKYLPLEIYNQGAKVQSTSSMGVVGECLAGLLATAGIGPWPIVRVINRWPDFIFHDRKNKRFALLESKAFSDINGSCVKFEDRFKKRILEDFLLDALRHLVSDRGVSVWGAFTCVKSIEPFKAQVTFVETVLQSGVTNTSKSTIVDALGEFVLQVALNSLFIVMSEFTEKQISAVFSSRNETPSDELNRAIQASLIQLPKSVTSSFTEIDIKQIEAEAYSIFKIKRKKIMALAKDINNISFKRSGFTTTSFEAIRKIGDIELIARRLSDDEATNLDKNWHPNWGMVNQFYTCDEENIFRCGGLLIKKKYL